MKVQPGHCQPTWGQRGGELTGPGHSGSGVQGRLTGGGSGVMSGFPRPGSWRGPGFGGSGSSRPRGCSERSLKPRSGEEG